MEAVPLSTARAWLRNRPSSVLFFRSFCWAPDTLEASGVNLLADGDFWRGLLGHEDSHRQDECRGDGDFRPQAGPMPGLGFVGNFPVNVCHLSELSYR